MAKSFKLGTVGLPEDEAKQLQTLFVLLRNDLEQDTLWMDGWGADVLLIDDDSLYGHMDWLKAQSMGKAVISITTREPREHEVVLRRPFSLEGLLNAVRQSGNLLSGAAPASVSPIAVRKTGEMPAVTTRKTDEMPSVTLPKRQTGEIPSVTALAGAPNAQRKTDENPAVALPPPPRRTGEQAAVVLPNRITGELPHVSASAAEVVGVAAIAPAPVAPTPPALPRNLIELIASGRIQRATKLVRPGQPHLIIDTANDRYFGPAGIKSLAEIFSAPLSLADWVDASDADINALPSDIKAHTGARLLWGIAIANSNGQLHSGLDANAKYKLSKWPQIEREYPKHFRIATALMKAPANIAEIAEQSGASVGEVNDFINAYAASGVAMPETATHVDTALTALAQALAQRLAT